MSEPLVLATLAIAAVAGTAVVLTRDPHRQAYMISANGVALTLLFLALQAPDVAISEVGVGAVIVPLLLLVTLTSIRNERRRAQEREAQE